MSKHKSKKNKITDVKSNMATTNHEKSNNVTTKIEKSNNAITNSDKSKNDTTNSDKSDLENPKKFKPEDNVEEAIESRKRFLKLAMLEGEQANVFVYCLLNDEAQDRYQKCEFIGTWDEKCVHVLQKKRL